MKQQSFQQQPSLKIHEEKIKQASKYRQEVMNSTKKLMRSISRGIHIN